MSLGLIDNSKLSAIGNAIRAKNGETVMYTPDEMAEKITLLSTYEDPVYQQIISNKFEDESDVVTGSFTPDSDLTEGYTIPLPDGKTELPYLVLLWVTDPPATSDGVNLTYRCGGMFMRIGTSYFTNTCASFIVANGAGTAEKGQGHSDMYIYPSTSYGGILVKSSTTYPLRSGVTYKWEMRWI